MYDSGRPHVINGITVDKDLVDVWPSDFAGCWLGVRKDDARGRTIFLVKSGAHGEGEIVEVDEPGEALIASLMWDTMYRMKAAWVHPDYRGNELGFVLARWAFAWVAKSQGKALKMPWYKNRTPTTQRWIEAWRDIYGGEESPK